MKYELVVKETGKVFYDDDAQCEVIVDAKDRSWINQLCFAMNGNRDFGKYFVRISK